MAKKGFFENKLIYAFGANGYAETIIHTLCLHNCKLSGILDNAIEKQGELIDGVEVYAPDAAKEKSDKVIVVIASNYYFEMLQQLESFGFQSEIDVFQLLPLVNRENIKYYWTKRAEIDPSAVPMMESIVTLNSSEKFARMQVELEQECIDKNIELTESDILVDLGAGIGRWSRHLAPRVKKVYAVEMIDKLAEISEKLTNEEKIENIVHVRQSAESFVPDFQVDCVFLSGILCYLDDEQYDRTINNASKMVKHSQKGRVFIRDSVSLQGIPYVRCAPKGGYSAYYRTPDMLVSRFAKEGFVLKKCGQFFENSLLAPKDDAKTAISYFLFIKK